MKKALMSLLVLTSLTLTACTKIVPIYRMDVQQGNIITQQQVNQLKPGLSKQQVAQIMGEPVLHSAFDPNRWDYVYTMKPGSGELQQNRITVFFKNGRLIKTEGSVHPS